MSERKRTRIEKSFNVQGPMRVEHYCVDMKTCIDTLEILRLIHEQQNMMLYGPSRTGKTTVLTTICRMLNEDGKYYAILVSAPLKYDLLEASERMAQSISQEMCILLGGDSIPETLCKSVVEGPRYVAMLQSYLQKLCAKLTRPLVLLLDDFDNLKGEARYGILDELRHGYCARKNADERPMNWLQSFILCGERDCCQMKTSGVPFNVAWSLELPNFTEQQIRDLYEQHTEETGQQYDPECFPVVWKLTSGQPFLVNLLAEMVRWKKKFSSNEPVTAADLDDAADDVVRGSPSLVHFKLMAHIWVLKDTLQKAMSGDASEADVEYLQEARVIIKDGSHYELANEIYRKMIPDWTWKQPRMPRGRAYQTAEYLRSDRSIKIDPLLSMFRMHFADHGRRVIKCKVMKEFAAQLMLYFFLLHLKDEGADVTFEADQNGKRPDILLTQPLRGGGMQRVVVEVKVQHLRKTLHSIIRDGVIQTGQYVAGCHGVKKEGHLIVFKRDETSQAQVQAQVTRGNDPDQVQEQATRNADPDQVQAQATRDGDPDQVQAQSTRDDGPDQVQAQTKRDDGPDQVQAQASRDDSPDQVQWQGIRDESVGSVQTQKHRDQPVSSSLVQQDRDESVHPSEYISQAYGEHTIKVWVI